METGAELMALWGILADRFKHGGAAFELAHGKEIWDYAAENPGFNMMFNEGMECTARALMKAILVQYQGFRGLRSVVGPKMPVGDRQSESVRGRY